MEFKNWLNEITTEPNYNPLARKLFRNDSKPYLSGSRIFHVNNGKIVDGYPEGGSSWRPYYEFNPRGKFIQLHNVDPSSKEFKQVVNTLRKFSPDIDTFDVSLMSLAHPQVADHKRNYYRKVGYWVGQKNTNINPNQKLPEFLYHGTSTELWYSGIRSKGLMPRMMSGMGAAGSYGSGSALSHPDKIYLSVHPDFAARGAAKQAASQHGGKPLILKISTSGLDADKITGDEDIDREYQATVKQSQEQGKRTPSFATVSQSRMGSVAYMGRIPATLIKPFVMGNMEQSGIISKWIPFKDIEQEEHALTKKLRQGGWFSSYDSPYFYALVDAGIVKPTEKDRLHYEVADPVNIDDKKIRELIKKSTWVRDANAIVKDLNDYGKNIKSLHYYPAQVDDKKYQKIIDMLVDSKIYYAEKSGNGGHYLSYSSWDATPKGIKLAKALHNNKMTYEQLISMINEMLDKYKPE